MRSPQHLPSSGPCVRSDNISSQRSIDDQFALRYRFALNNDTNPAKRRELRSPALSLRPLGVAQLTRTSRPLAGTLRHDPDRQPRQFHFAPPHSAPLATRHTRSPIAPAKGAATQSPALPPGAVPDGSLRLHSVPLRENRRAWLRTPASASPVLAPETLVAAGAARTSLASAAASVMRWPPILACPAGRQPVPGFPSTPIAGARFRQQGKTVDEKTTNAPASTLSPPLTLSADASW
jgi:hypothetical protein